MLKYSTYFFLILFWVKFYNKSQFNVPKSRVFILRTTTIYTYFHYRVNLEESHPVQTVATLQNTDMNSTIALQAANNISERLVQNAYYESAGLSRYDCIYIYTGKWFQILFFTFVLSFELSHVICPIYDA